MLSDLLFVLGVSITCVLTGILIGNIGVAHPCYIGSIESVEVMFSIMVILFSLGYWSGRFFKGEK
jgi:hypothetical protein